jgi:hypothetical protein
VFQERFEVEHVVVRVGAEALDFRRRHAGQWRKLLLAGVSEEDLLVKSMSVILRKPG